MVSDAESLGAQDRIPREAIEAAKDVLHERTDMCRGSDICVTRHVAAEALEAAYPLIRERVCQELAEAIRRMPDRERFSDDNSRFAEFVESFGGASPGGETPD